MKISVKSLFLTVALIGANIGKINAQSLEGIQELVFPETDIEYVDRKSWGHMHKNKPHYQKKDWVVMETPHFLIYITSDTDKRLKTFYKKEAEVFYKEFASRMDMNRFTKKIRVVVPNSARGFEENNLFGFLPKRVGGATDMFKWKRMLIAYRDSPQGLRWLFRHELVHRFQGEFLQLTLFNSWRRDLPLWFTEGSAEYLSQNWDSVGDLVMRHAYLNGYLMPATELGPWPGTMVYSEGAFLFHAMNEIYKGKADFIIASILRDGPRMKFAPAFQKASGDTLEEFNKKVFRYIEKRYVSIRAKTDIADEAKSAGDGILMAAKDNFFITSKFDAGRIALFLNWTNGVSVKSKKLVESGKLKSVDIRGGIELEPDFGFREHGASFISTNTLIYAVDIGGRDEFAVQEFSFDQNKKKFRLGKKSQYAFSGMEDMQYPVAISEYEIAFVGRRGGVFAEIFIGDLRTGIAKQLTSGQRTYRGLTYSKAHNALITSVENEATDSYDLAKYDLASGVFSFIAQTPENEFYMACSPDGKEMLYVSDKGLVHNIYRYDFEVKKVELLTDAKVGMLRPQWFSEKGMAFNALTEKGLEIKIAPLPKAVSAASVKTALSPKNEDEKVLAALRLKIPNAESMTIFDAVISSDKTKALFAENRNLSMEVLKRGDAEVRFHLLDSSSGVVTTFTLDEFKKIENYGSASFLAGTNLLLQKQKVSVERIEPLSNSNDGISRNNEPIEEEVTYKESFIYDWEKKELHDINTEMLSEILGDSHFLSKLSPDKRFLIWVDKDRNYIWLYDVIVKEKRKLAKKFYEIQDVEFTGEAKILVLDRKWDLSVSELGVTTETVKTWEKIIALDKIKSDKPVFWYPIFNSSKIFLIVPNKKEGWDAMIFDALLSTVTLALPEISSVRKAELKSGALNLTIANAYGMDRTIVVSSSGTVETVDEEFPYSIVHSSYVNTASPKLVLPRSWNLEDDIPTRNRGLYKLPRIMNGRALAGIGFGRGGMQSYIASQLLALDEINDKVFATNIFLQNLYQGIAGIGYYNLNTGRSYELDYWHLDDVRSKLDVGISQNIFLHEFLNWDVTLKEQQVRNDRDYGRVQWSRTKIGTTFSLDTAVWDCEAVGWYCHGPHSGLRAFTGTEMGFDAQKGFQNVEVNAEIRYYVPIFGRSGLAFRTLGGRSFGPNPTTYVWGGNQTFRGVPLYSQAGDTYVMQSSEFRFPIIDIIGVVFSGPVGEGFAPLTLFRDIRGGLYHDIGDIWYGKKPLFDGHQGFKPQQSAGYFINIPTIFGLNMRYNKGVFGRKDWNFWLGYSW